MRGAPPRLLVVVLLGLLLSRTGWRAVPAVAGSPAYFPLQPGTYWVYRGSVKWTEGREVREREMTWRMEVLKVLDRHGIAAFLLRGHPGDLVSFEEDREPGEYAILRSGSGRFYLTDAEALTVLERPEAPRGLLRDWELFLDFPLTPGKKFCDAEGMSRPDGFYCWVVESSQAPSSWSVTGAPRPERVAVVRYRTLPDEVTVDFAEGLGIVRYRYLHHGTVSEVDVHLVDYHRGRGD
jgi:hypothetical protein